MPSFHQDAFPRGLGVGMSCNRTRFDKPLTDAQLYRQLDILKPDWWYDWGYHTRIGKWPDHPIWGPRYVPMMYARFDQHVAAHVGRGKALLCLNEPDRESQANLSPYEGARQVQAAVAAGYRIMAPGIVLNESEAYPYGWVTRYLEAGGPVPEAWHVHVYDCPTWNAFKKRIDTFRKWTIQNGVARTIFVTETNCQERHQREHVRLLSEIKRDISENEKRPDLRVAESVAWFSNRYRNPWTGAHDRANLFEPDDKRLTWVGDVFASSRG